MWEALSLWESTEDGAYNLKYPLQVVAAARTATPSLVLWVARTLRKVNGPGRSASILWELLTVGHQ